jgi:hypothetical protein
MDKEEKEKQAVEIVELALLLTNMNIEMANLSSLGITPQTISFIGQGLGMATGELEKKVRDFQFKQIIDPLDKKEK